MPTSPYRMRHKISVCWTCLPETGESACTPQLCSCSALRRLCLVKKSGQATAIRLSPGNDVIGTYETRSTTAWERDNGFAEAREQ